jgi:hypothetical protein
MSTKRAAVLLTIIFAFQAFAGDPAEWSITPSSGSVNGGTKVRITGPLGSWPYGAVFGGAWAPETFRVDDNTLEVLTPPHAPGTVEVTLFEYDIYLSTPLTFTYQGELPEEEYERILLPVFIPPTTGAHGAEFRTDLRLEARTTEATVRGLLVDCIVLCIEPPDSPITLYAYNNHDTLNLVPNGTPGRFIYVGKAEARELVAHLRAYDVSREATNYGTELPVVRYDDFETTIVLPSVPTDPRFRNNLRIYAKEPVRVTITAGEVQETVQLSAPANEYEPAYATWSNFPANAGSVKVTLRAQGTERIWGFATVTNNETQAITTVTPQP